MPAFSLAQAQNLCDSRETPTVEVTHSFGEENPDLSRAQAVLLTLHDGRTGYSFPAAVQRIIEPIRSEVEKYLHIERDVGTREIADAILRGVPDAVGFHVLVPRGFVDVNRESQYAVPVLHNAESDPEAEAYRELQKLYEDTRRVLMTLLQAVPAKIAVDVHSMSPSTPAVNYRAPSLSSERSFQEHSAAWNSPGVARPTQIFHSVQDNDRMRPIASGSEELAALVASELNVKGYETSFISPYTLIHGKHMSHVYLGTFLHSVAVDIPKNHVAVSPNASGLEYMQPDGTKTQKLAECIVQALHKVLKTISNGRKI